MVTSCNKLGFFFPPVVTHLSYSTQIGLFKLFIFVKLQFGWSGVGSRLRRMTNLFRTCWMYLKSCLLGRKEGSIKKSNFRAIHKNWAADPAAPHPSRSAAAPVAVFWLGVGQGKAGAWLRTGPELTRHLGTGEQHLSVPSGMSSSKGTFGS